MLIFLIGTIPSFVSGNWGWFARSGALFVVLGASLAWLDFRSLEELRVKTLGESTDNLIINVQSLFKLYEINAIRIENIERHTITLEPEKTVHFQAIKDVANSVHGALDQLTDEAMSNVKNLSDYQIEVNSHIESADSEAKKIGRSMRIAEIILVVAGTLIWAYGDLVKHIL